MSCLNCALYFKCKKPKEHICSHFKELTKKDVNSFFLAKKTVDIPDYADSSIADICKAILQEKPVEAKVDDRDFPLASNFAHWCYDKKYLNLKESAPPFAWQLKIGLDLFQEVCPYCSDMKWWDDLPVDAKAGEINNKLTLLKWGKCPKCKRTVQELLAEHAIKPYIVLATCAGQRAGKSAVGSIIASYQTHKFVKIDIAKEFRLSPNSQFQATFTALVYDQVHRNFYSPYLTLLQTAPWFKDYFEMLKDVGNKYGEELYNLGEKFVRFKHRRMTIMPKSPNVLFMRGYTSFMTAIDEIGLFADSSANSNRFDADGLFQTLSTSLLTLEGAWKKQIEAGKYWLPKPISINISSPYSVSDKIMRLVHESKSSNRIIGFKKATWEINPTLPEDSDFVKDRFKENYAMAMRDLACVPPASANPFIEDDDFSIIKKISTIEPNNLILKAEKSITATGKGATTASISNIYSNKNPAIVAVDAGSVDNSFAITIVQVENDIIQFKVLQEIIPISRKPINYSKVYKDVLTRILKEWNVLAFVTDRWQSLKFLHDVEEDFKIPSFQYSVKYQDFVDFREAIIDSKISIPRPEVKIEDILTTADFNYPECYRDKPISHFCMEMLTVQDLGKTVIKGQNRTDDIFRAVVLGYHYATLPEYKKKLSVRLGQKNTNVTSVFRAEYTSGLTHIKGGAYRGGTSW